MLCNNYFLFWIRIVCVKIIIAFVFLFKNKPTNLPNSNKIITLKENKIHNDEENYCVIIFRIYHDGFV